jgi:hypothetical protein
MRAKTMVARLTAHAALAGAVLLVAPAASAQSLGAIALNQLEPAPAGDALFGVPSPFASGHLIPRGLLLFDHAEQPLVVVSGSTESPIVARQTFLHVNASLALWDRLLVSALFPVALAQGGDSPSAQGITFASPTSAAAGDLRLGVRMRFFGAEADPFQVAVGVYVHLPTGASDSFVGEGAVRESPHLSLGGRVDRFVWSASVGASIRASGNPSTLTYGGGAAVVLWQERLQIGPEVFASTDLQEGYVAVSEATTIKRDMTTNAEVLVSARFRIVSGLFASLAGGPGLTGAIGTPAFRVAASVGWMPVAEKAEKE